MNLKRILKILSKDFSVGPRKPFFIWALLLPFALTLVFQFAFGSLFEPKPKLGIVDFGSSAVTTEIQELEGFEVTIFSDVDELLNQVENHDLDAGHAVKNGQKPLLEFYISGESLASNRIIISVTALEMIRDLEGGEAPVDWRTRFADFNPPCPGHRFLCPGDGRHLGSQFKPG